MALLLVGCSKEDGESTSNPSLTKGFLQMNAEVGLTKSEVEEVFGGHYFSGECDFETNEVWVYDQVKDGFTYEVNTQNVPFDAIRAGDVDY